MEYSLDDKVILVTGGTGSFGQKFIEVLLNEHHPRSIRIYSRGELLQIQMEQRFNDHRLRFLIGDVRDRQRLSRAMNGVNVVVHAAALKHVPACEYNPIEAVKTNIDGTVNVIDAAIDNGVDRVMTISTDKAVHPVNLYGATKMVAEKLIIQGNSYAGGRVTKLSCVRYGNVIGSRGSVIPLFREQMKQGYITITDTRMTRFWITLEQGVRFVIDSLQRMRGGEVFIPRIPSMRIMDLAEAIAPGMERRVIGIRSGEKIHEVLLTEDEARHSLDCRTHFIIEPEHSFWKKGRGADEVPLPDSFRYTSDTNDRWLGVDELKQILAGET